MITLTIAQAKYLIETIEDEWGDGELDEGEECSRLGKIVADLKRQVKAN